MDEISDEMYEALRLILEKKNQKIYSFKDVKEIGDELVDFYSLLIKLYDDKQDPETPRSA